MTDLPAIFAFDLNEFELVDHLEHAMRQRQAERAVLSDMAYEIAAKEHFLLRLRRVPTEQLGGKGKAGLTYSVAQNLARNARLMPDRSLEVRKALTAEAEDARMKWLTFLERINILQQIGLITIRARGSGSGRPYHIQINNLPGHADEIAKIAGKLIGEHFKRQMSALRYG